jgi:hypothetical protein
MPMNSSASADFSKGRPAAERSNKLRVPATIRNLITRIRLWLGKLFSLAFARVLLIFLLGFAAGIAWQSYGSGVRKAIAGWSPRLVWLAPAPAPSGGSAERFKAVSLALASARQSLDKLSTEINRLEVQGADSGPSRTVIPTGQARQSAQPSACAHRCSSLIVTTHGFLLTREDEDDGQNNDDRR